MCILEERSDLPYGCKNRLFNVRKNSALLMLEDFFFKDKVFFLTRVFNHIKGNLNKIFHGDFGEGDFCECEIAWMMKFQKSDADLFSNLVRSNHKMCSVKKVVLKNFANFPGKHLSWSVFFNEVAASGIFY